MSDEIQWCSEHGTTTNSKCDVCQEVARRSLAVRTGSVSFPFVLTVDSIAGGTVKDACKNLILFSRHVGCQVRAEINDTEITVCGAIMTPEDAYKQWQHYSQNAEISGRGESVESSTKGNQ